MKHVFIAVGGSGTKVAEALVRLLAIGFPTSGENGNLTSVDDQLEIWRVDSDESSGAADALRTALEDYAALQRAFRDGGDGATLAHSRWAMSIETNVRHLDPTELPRSNPNDNQSKTLRGILDSQFTNADGRQINRSSDLLAPFYDERDLDIEVDRGFYQKPFIGAAIMAIFARSLEKTNTPGGAKAGLKDYDSTPANFFLCGSLHGGTGACGVPVMAKFFSDRKSRDWRVGGCLLAPYVKPPNPPFDPLEAGAPLRADDVSEKVSSFANHPAFHEMNPGEKEKLVKQILLGFYAKPDDMEFRAEQSLSYYRDHGAENFDELYLVGKPSPNQLQTWSNGGRSQRNPLNSAEVAAAVAALNFFANKTNAGRRGEYIVGSGARDIEQDTMKLRDLPTYRVGNQEIDAEKVFLASALAHHLVLHQIKWDNVRGAVREQKICQFYDRRPNQAETDLTLFREAMRALGNSLLSLIPTHHINQPTGWSGDDYADIERLLANVGSCGYEEVELNLSRNWRGNPKGENRLGTASVKFTTFDFGKWCPGGEAVFTGNATFTRGEYFRYVWQKIYSEAKTSTNV